MQEEREMMPLDRDRIASMADEGGTAAAEMDLIEQLALVPVSTVRTRFPTVRVLVGAIVVGVAAALMSRFWASGRSKPRARRWKLR